MLLGLTFAFNAFATYYYLVIAEATNTTVMIGGLVVLWTVWIAALIITLMSSPASRSDRAVAAMAPACVVLGTALFFLV